MMTKLKKWWGARETLFHIQATVSIYSVDFCMSVLGCAIRAGLDFQSLLRWIRLSRRFCIFRRHFIWYKKLGANKALETELYCDGALTTGFTFYKHIHCDHTPCRLEFALLGMTIGIDHYDGRHWDYDNDTYAV